jgi:DegV family protein with EDD domain
MSKARVAIVTDSTCNLPDEFVEKHNIHVIPQTLVWDGETLLDGVDITPEQFYERLANSRSIPTTSQASAGEFLELFKRIAGEAESILAILVSDELSGTLDSARAAVGMMEEFPIEIVDSRSSSMGLGLIALAAARAVEGGATLAEAAEIAKSLVPRMRVLFVVDTLEYLHKGGRIGGAQRLIGSMLSLKPLLQVEDGRIEAKAKIRTKKKAISHLLDVVMNETSGNKGVHASVINAAAPEEGRYLFDTVRERIQPVEISFCELTPVVGTHVGPGTVGIAYYSEAGN